MKEGKTMTDEKIKSLCQNVYDEAVEIRRILHENPELGNREFSTTKLIISLLKKWNIEVSTPLETGAVGTLCGKAGKKVLAFRADIDALAINEETNLPYCSKVPNVMHACGHDIHTASLLAAAKVLSENRDSFCGTVKFIFQPDEEGNGGAERLIASGALDDVDKIFGIHISPEMKSGTIGIKYGKSYAAADVFKIKVIGKSAHGAQPQNGVNAVLAAANIANALSSLVPRITEPTDSAVLSVCKLNGGSAINIIPEYAELSGIIRTLGPETREKMKAELVKTAESSANAYGAKAEVTIIPSYPGIVNHDEDVAFIEKLGRDFLGAENVIVLSQPTMTTEDFGFYLEKSGGCFYHLGVSGNYPLHSSRLAPDESAMKAAICMHVKTAVEYLK